MKTDIPDKQAVPNRLAVYVSSGTPVIGATVSLYADMERKSPHKAAVTGADGVARLETLSIITGSMIVCASGGSFFDPATGVATTLTREWCEVVDVQPGAVNTVALTPWSVLVNALANSPLGRAQAAESTSDLGAALTDAHNKLDAFFGCPSGAPVTSALPTDLTIANEVPSTITAETMAAHSLAAFSMQAKLIAEAQGKTPGITTNMLTVVDAYAEDLAHDGIQQGLGASGQIFIDYYYALTGLSLRNGPQSYTHGLRRFLESDRNLTGVHADDLQDLLACLSQSENDAVILAPGLETTELDSEAPRVEITSLEDGAMIGASSTITCAAEDDHSIRSLQLLARRSSVPTTLPENVWKNVQSTQASEFGSITATLETTLIDDGNIEIVCSASDEYGYVGQSVKTVVVNNHGISPGMICGGVYAETPIHGATVTAYTYESMQPKRALGNSITDESGHFCLSAIDNYKGPILLKAEGRSAKGTNAITLQPFEFGTNILTLLLDDYSPRQTVTGLSINLFTSLATAFVEGFAYSQPPWLEAQTLPAYSTAAHYWIGRHARSAGQEPIDVRFTPVRNLVTGLSTEETQDATELGLQSVALARLGASIELAEGGDTATIHNMASPQVVEQLSKDARDGVFDGLSRDGAAIYWTTRLQRPLTIDAYRWDLANEQLLWLDNVLVHDSLPAANASGLTSAPFNVQGGMLWNIASDLSPLFDLSKPLKPWDLEGPELTNIAFSTDPETPMRGEVTVDIVAEDVSGVRDITVEIVGTDNASLRSGRPGVTGTSQVIIDTTKLADGDHTVRIASTDVSQNVREKTFNITVDNTAPEVSAELITDAEEGWIRDPNATVAGTITDAFDLASVQFVVNNETKLTVEHPSKGEYSHIVPLGECNQSYEVQVVTTDLAGNSSHSNSIPVKCDNQPPTLNWDAFEEFCPALTCIDGEYQDGRLIYESSNGDASSLPWDNTEVVPVITQFVQFLDEYPAAEVTGSSNPLPTLAFRVEDAVQDKPSTAESHLQVFYQVLRDGEVSRSWMPVQTASSGGSFKLPLSYQTLLPLFSTAEDNYLATSRLDEEHTVEIKVIDLAGNEVIDSRSFRLNLILPFAEIHSCAMAEDLSLRSLSALNLHGYFNGVSKAFATANVRWDFDAPEGSLLPAARATLTLAGGADLTTLMYLEPVKATGQAYPLDENTIGWCLPRVDSGYLTRHQLSNRSYDDRRNCFERWYVLQNDDSLPVYELTSHESTFALQGGEQLNSNTYEITPGQVALTLTAINPTIKDPWERTWNWPTILDTSKKPNRWRYTYTTGLQGRDLTSRSMAASPKLYEATDWQSHASPYIFLVDITPPVISLHSEQYDRPIEVRNSTCNQSLRKNLE